MAQGRYNLNYRLLAKKLKSIPVIYDLNALLKGIIDAWKWNKLVSYYSGISQPASNPNYTPLKILRKERLNLFWVGANYDQDKSGFLQALEKYFNVTVFFNDGGNYGLIFTNGNSFSKRYDKKIIDKNDRAFKKQIKSLHDSNGVDLIFGQLWANYISHNAIAYARNLGIPVINLSMDDKLPSNWSSITDKKYGAIGLAKDVNLTLTTSEVVVDWYKKEGCNAIFFPLASDPEVFKYSVDTNRDIDVLFIGNKYGLRGKLIQGLKNRGINVDAWGGGWENGYADINKSIELFSRAKIILGSGVVGYMKKHYTLKLRDFDAMMSGALYITSRNPDLLKIFTEEKEVICYDSISECAEKINFYLNNDQNRLAVAFNGLQKAVATCTWDIRIQEFRRLLYS